MARLHSIKISHYRGLENFEQVFGNSNCVVLIGRGDSGKTTILKAISALLSPAWNTTFSDYDFTNMNTDVPIIIEAIMSDVPKELLDINKYGEYIQLIDKESNVVPYIEDAETATQSNIVLKIRLTVTNTLEPLWEVVSDREIGNKVLSANDRAKFSMHMIADYVDNHFSYSKGSPLYSAIRALLEKGDKQSVEQKLMSINRTAYETIKAASTFEELKDVTAQITANAKELGLTVSELATLLEYKSNTFSESNVSLHSADIPYKMFGKGSKRLLSIAIQYGLVQTGGIVLIDEIEQGLEPDRVRNLTRKLSKVPNGQVFITTHSRDVVLEPSANQIFLMKKGESHLITFNKELQGTLRRYPEAFFAKRIISCEGATEEGIIRAISDNLQESRGYGIAAQGIVHIDGGGSNKFYKVALALKSNGYDTLVFCDDDLRKLDEEKQQAISKGVNVITCETGNAIESQLFKDLPWDAICELVSYALEEHKDSKIILPITGFKYKTIQELKSAPLEEQVQLRKQIAISAKANTDNGGWYKSIHHGEFIGRIWIKYYDKLSNDCRLKEELDELIKWIGNDIE
jgi:predicted ATP-dependent endonuclease of OLD family